MKLIIENDLKHIESNLDSVDEYNFMASVCDKFNVHYMLDIREDSTTFIIYTQKCTLDEFYMNELFHDVLYLFEYNVVYARFGGAGCDFAMRISENYI